MEGWVDLGALTRPQPGIEPTTALIKSPTPKPLRHQDNHHYSYYYYCHCHYSGRNATFVNCAIKILFPTYLLNYLITTTTERDSGRYYQRGRYTWCVLVVLSTVRCQVPLIASVQSCTPLSEYSPRSAEYRLRLATTYCHLIGWRKQQQTNTTSWLATTVNNCNSLVGCLNSSQQFITRS